MQAQPSKPDPIVYKEYSAVNSDEVCGICQDLLFEPATYQGRVFAHRHLDGKEGLQDPVHEYCIKNWLLKTQNCPYCRSCIDPSDIIFFEDKVIHQIKTSFFNYFEKHADNLENWPITLRISNLVANLGVIVPIAVTWYDYQSMDLNSIAIRSFLFTILLLNKVDYHFTIQILRERGYRV